MRSWQDLCVRIKGRAGTGDVRVGVCYRTLTRKTEQVRSSTD